ncbi:hypothetical protein ASJ79_20455 [Mycobacterium sp. NAZ190054]|nr:hypothetical protein ASJ79_20455 [Mycobacterium sp. NAZ190054]
MSDDPLMTLLQDADGVEKVVQKSRRGGSALRDEVQLLAPLGGPEKIICIGLNYVSHMVETRAERPTEPVIFSKYNNSIIGPYDTVVLPAVAPKRVDYEAELAVVIGKAGRNVHEAEAGSFVAGYCVANDVSARDWQLKKPNGQWLLGKTFDTFLPLGPALVTQEDLPDYRSLRITCAVSGEPRQDAELSEMIFSVEELIAYASRVFTLRPGDVILTGTPGGVGMVRGRDGYLKDGDLLETQIEGLGALMNPVVGEAIDNA